MAKRTKKDKDIKKLERMTRKLKEQEKLLADDISSYVRMTADLEKNIELFRFICHASVIAQDAKYQSLQSEEKKAAISKLAELKKLDVAIKEITNNHLQKVKNILNLMKLTRKNPQQLMQIIGEQLIPGLGDLQTAFMNIFDMVNMCIPKNREAIEELAQTDPQFREILIALDRLNANLKTKQDSTPEQTETSDEYAFAGVLLEPDSTTV